MTDHEHLSEFTSHQRKPKKFYLVLGAMLIISCFACIPVFFSFQQLLEGADKISLTYIIILAVITVYPVIGCYGVYHLKKYGWIIWAHYSISATVLSALLILTEFPTDPGKKEILQLSFELFIGLLSLHTVINLFKKKYLDAFLIDKTYIFLAFLLTILFPLFWFGILVTVDRMN